MPQPVSSPDNDRDRVTSKDLEAFKLPAIRLDLADPELFGNDAGEDESPEILASYFLDQPSFDRFFNRGTRLQFARAKKGMGKSALLSKLAYDLEQRSGAVVLINTTGAALVGDVNTLVEDHAVLQNYWKQTLCTRVNAAIGEQIGIALSDTSMSMVEVAEIQGFKGKNLVGSLVARLQGKIGSLQLQSSIPKDAALLLARYQADHPNATIWLLIDDIDSTFENTRAWRARVSSFFSACRALARDVEGLRIRASVRADVWTSIRYNEDLDKCEQYMLDIVWSNSELEQMLAKRIHAYVTRTQPETEIAKKLRPEANSRALLQVAFERRMQWVGNWVPPFHPIKVLSAGRPRWIAQLCRLAGRAAAKRKSSRIAIADIRDVMKTFGRLRLNDLYKEHLHQYADLERLVSSFAHGQPRYTVDQLILRIQQQYIETASATSLPALAEHAMPSVLELAQFLFKVGFIMARQVSSTSSNPVFISYDERPDLLRPGSAAGQHIVWEVYPSCRAVLSITQSMAA